MSRGWDVSCQTECMAIDVGTMTEGTEIFSGDGVVLTKNVGTMVDFGKGCEFFEREISSIDEVILAEELIGSMKESGEMEEFGRVTRSKGVVPDYPNVTDKTIEYTVGKSLKKSSAPCMERVAKLRKASGVLISEVGGVLEGLRKDFSELRQGRNTDMREEGRFGLD